MLDKGPKQSQQNKPDKSDRTDRTKPAGPMGETFFAKKVKKVRFFGYIRCYPILTPTRTQGGYEMSDRRFLRWVIGLWIVVFAIVAGALAAAHRAEIARALSVLLRSHITSASC